MDTYLLLRSNKQSGPYSLQQLVTFGLKPYDLVWVEGKSAAWRYPSEVDGLKAYAPATEEQPFDRFYKKTEQKVEEKVNNKPIEKREETPLIAIENSMPVSKKVFVSMPVNATKRQPAVVTASAPVSVPESKPVIKEEKPESKKAGSKPIYITEETNEPIIKEKKVINEPVLTENYSESLDEIKRRYTETYLSRKKRSGWTSTHTSIAQVLGGAVFFCLLVVFVYKNFSGDDSSQLSRTTVIQPDKRNVNKMQDVTDIKTTFPATPNKENSKSKEKQKPEPVNKEINPPGETAVVPVVQKTDDPVNETDYSILAKTTDKNEEQSIAEEVKPKTRPVNIRKFISVRANNYKQMAFGGVKNLELTLNNDSKFALDKVIVELQYLKPSEQPIKTERLVFNSVPAGDSKTLKIPDYLRGVKIAYRVVEIESSQYERQTAGL